MKFTKENAIEKLNQVLTNSGKKTLRMSKRTLESQTESLMGLIADDEMELDAFVEKVKPILEGVNGNIEHDISDFVKNYKPAPKKDPEPDPTKDPEDPKYSALMKEIEALKKESKERADKETLATKRSEIKKYLKDKKVSNDEWVDSILEATGLGVEDDVETKGEVLLKLYNKHFAADPTRGPGEPNPGGGKDTDTFASLKELKKSREQAE